jgi:hypothetical protein
MGEDPKGGQEGLRPVFKQHLGLDFEHLFLAMENSGSTKQKRSKAVSLPTR